MTGPTTIDGLVMSRPTVSGVAVWIVYRILKSRRQGKGSAFWECRRPRMIRNDKESCGFACQQHFGDRYETLPL